MPGPLLLYCYIATNADGHRIDWGALRATTSAQAEQMLAAHLVAQEFAGTVDARFCQMDDTGAPGRMGDTGHRWDAALDLDAVRDAQAERHGAHTAAGDEAGDSDYDGVICTHCKYRHSPHITCEEDAAMR